MSTAEPLVVLYATFGDVAEAERTGRSLIEARLAACVNILPGMISLYRWEGSIQRGSEVVMIVKTRQALAEAAISALRAAHSYDVPAIVALPVVAGAGPFLDWVRAETVKETT